MVVLRKYCFSATRRKSEKSRRQNNCRIKNEVTGFKLQAISYFKFHCSPVIIADIFFKRLHYYG